MGLCPLHGDRKPSSTVDPNKGLFYCYGFGRGADVIRFAELYHEVRFPQALALLRQWLGLAPFVPIKNSERFAMMGLDPSSNVVPDRCS